MLIIHHPDSVTYGLPGHPERPERIIATEHRLRGKAPNRAWQLARPGPDEAILLAHTPEHLARLNIHEPFDADTPHHENIAQLARLSVGAGLIAVEEARLGQQAFCLMRPPGHHCTADRAMGFCYLSNIAIAALQARKTGSQRVAIWDFDAHHGNGTEAILRGREGVLFVSVHQYPGYPGTGAEAVENCLNMPVLPNTESSEHMKTLRRSWEAVLDFAPDLVLVSAGFDAYKRDPITTMCLERDDFLTLGSWLHDANLPTAALLEGGYSDDLPELVEAFLEGWQDG